MTKTIYQKIYTDLIFKIKTGALKSGDALPSTRELSKLYKCHRFTVMRVCQDLVAEGWVDSSQRSRYTVSTKIPVTNSAASKKIDKKKDISTIANQFPEFDLERTKYPLEFWGGQPDLRLFPRDEFRRVICGGNTEVDKAINLRQSS